MRLGRDASLHESTVQAAGERVFRHRRPRRASGSRSGEVELAQVHGAVWAKVCELLDSGHGYTRPEVVSLTEVVVR